MSRFCKLSVLLLLLTIASQSSVFGQGSAFSGMAFSNETSAYGQIVQPIGGAVITVCPHSAAPTIPCTGPVTLYTDITLSSSTGTNVSGYAVTNPFNADVNGNFVFYAPNIASGYDVSITGAGVIGKVYPIGGGSGGAGGAVSSVFGRTGAVGANSGDYSCAQVTGCTASVSSVFGRVGTVAAQAGDYSCAQVTGCSTSSGIIDYFVTPAGTSLATAMSNCSGSLPNGCTVYIAHGSYTGPSAGITIPSNVTLIIAAGVTWTGFSPNTSNTPLLIINGTTNIAIIGAGAGTSVFHMVTNVYNAGSDCIKISGGASNIYISGISATGCNEDGLYLRQATNVTVADSIFSGSLRQGSSITGQVTHVHYIRDQFNTNSGQPGDGLDIEPNATGDFYTDVVIDSCSETGNTGTGGTLYGAGLSVVPVTLTSASAPVSITIINNRTSGNVNAGYVFLNNTGTNNPKGSVTIVDSFSEGDTLACVDSHDWQDGGESITFQNFTCINPNSGGVAAPALLVERGGGQMGNMGNVYFFNTNVFATNGKTTNYLSIQDGSSIGISNIVFDARGSLSGASLANVLETATSYYAVGKNINCVAACAVY